MVFVTVGSTRNDFSRLLREVDRLSECGILQDVRAQIGMSTYAPRSFSSERFLSRQEFLSRIRDASFVITHAGTGSVNMCLGLRKRIIVVPRRKIFGEHPDDHQTELTDYLEARGRILAVRDPERELEEAVRRIDSWTPVFRSDSGVSPLFEMLGSLLSEEFLAGKGEVLHNLD